MIVSLAEGAKLAGVSRQTIYRKSKNGDLSTTKRPDGTKGVDTSELERVFGNITVSEPVTVTVTAESDTVGQVETADVTLLEVKLASAERRIADLEADKSKLWDQVESQRLLLEHKGQESSPPASLKIDKDAAFLLILGAIVVGGTAALLISVFPSF